jgi:hypothetical protein
MNARTLASSLLCVLTLCAATPARAAETYADEVSGVTIHAPEGWTKAKQATNDKDLNRVQFNFGEPKAPKTFYVFKLGHTTERDDLTVEQFAKVMAEQFPRDWKAEPTGKVMIGKQQVEALKLPYAFTANNIEWRMDLYLFKRGKAFTYFQVMALKDGWPAAERAFEGLLKDVEIAEPKGAAGK